MESPTVNDAMPEPCTSSGMTARSLNCPTNPVTGSLDRPDPEERPHRPGPRHRSRHARNVTGSGPAASLTVGRVPSGRPGRSLSGDDVALVWMRIDRTARRGRVSGGHCGCDGSGRNLRAGPCRLDPPDAGHCGSGPCWAGLGIRDQVRRCAGHRLRRSVGVAGGQSQ